VSLRDALDAIGLKGTGAVYRNLPPARLVEEALARGEGMLAANGALVVRTGARTGRSPRDRYVVRDAQTENKVWWGPVNQPLDSLQFDRLFERARERLAHRELFVFDGYAGADRGHRLPLRVVAEKAWHALFAHTLFLRPAAADRAPTSRSRWISRGASSCCWARTTRAR
jgi:phosphoenolpyruvate carboxykinase (ATP)